MVVITLAALLAFMALPGAMLAFSGALLLRGTRSKRLGGMLIIIGAIMTAVPLLMAGLAVIFTRLSP